MDISDLKPEYQVLDKRSMSLFKTLKSFQVKSEENGVLVTANLKILREPGLTVRFSFKFTIAREEQLLAASEIKKVFI